MNQRQLRYIPKYIWNQQTVNEELFAWAIPVPFYTGIYPRMAYGTLTEAYSS